MWGCRMGAGFGSGLKDGGVSMLGGCSPVWGYRMGVLPLFGGSGWGYDPV